MSAPGPAPLPPHAPASGPALAPAPGPAPARGPTWLVTFTDLVALMITFFVLMFSMSRVEHQKWQDLVSALAPNLNAVREHDRPRPAIEYQSDEAPAVPGTNLDYLARVVLEQIASDPDLAPTVIRRLPDRLVISLPADLLYRPGAAGLREPAGPLALSIAGVLRSLDNVVEVEAYGAPADGGGGDPAAWRLSLARAATLARLFAGAGHDGPIVARGYGESRPGGLAAHLSDERDRAFASRLDIVILDRIAGPP